MVLITWYWGHFKITVRSKSLASRWVVTVEHWNGLLREAVEFPSLWRFKLAWIWPWITDLALKLALLWAGGLLDYLQRSFTARFILWLRELLWSRKEASRHIQKWKKGKEWKALIPPKEIKLRVGSATHLLNSRNYVISVWTWRRNRFLCTIQKWPRKFRKWRHSLPWNKRQHSMGKYLYRMEHELWTLQ